MAYRKFTSDRIFSGYTMLDPGTVLITDENGEITDLVATPDAGDDIEKLNGIICPGFINCHCHLELSHMKGVAKRHSGMTDFLLTVMSNRNTDIRDIISAMEEQEMEMMRNGIVAVGDICNTAHSAGIKKRKNLYYHNFIEATGFAEANAEERFSTALEVYGQFSVLIPWGESGSSIVPHAPYSVSDKLFDLINSMPRNRLLTMHNQESADETDFIQWGRGEFVRLFRTLGTEEGFIAHGHSSLMHALKKISSAHSLILVHNVHTTKDDLVTIAHADSFPELYWCLCPNANLYINGLLPDVKLLKDYNAKLVLGTDSLASNDQLNILEEIKILQKYMPDLSISELLKWATINGAEALGIEGRYGSFEKGKYPGVLHIAWNESNSLEHGVARRIL